MKRISDIIPGKILSEEFLIPIKITADTALRLSACFGNSADFWLGIQDEYDLRLERCKIEEKLKAIPHAEAP